ncbi:beta-1,4-N-acetylgalactosaminyltransferase [Helicobacter pylori]|uniref:beta-1,4-N-acetylgalactosaminyltransferase n=1 Tax=Helicobacter pylori TaxID=210 RepID=UPI000A78D781|nr:beta-1,4-N-acetylgalactosaminyltransferase [Helicobacter pylori]
MGLKNKIKGFVKERMPFVVRCVRSLKGAKDIYDEINHEIKEMLEAKKLHSLQEKALFKTTQAEIPNIFSVWDECFSSARNYIKTLSETNLDFLYTP